MASFCVTSSWRIAPKDPKIAQFIQCYWFIEKSSDDKGHAYPRLNPDPAATYIIAPPEQTYRYQNTDDEFSSKGCHWIYPNRQMVQLDHSEPFTILGIKFHTGALSCFPYWQSEPILDQVSYSEPSSLGFPADFDVLALLDKNRQSPELSRDRLDHLLVPFVNKHSDTKRYLQCHNAESFLLDFPVSAIGEKLHCAQRTIERNFLRTTGLTLKQCQVMHKFEAMLSHLYQHETEVNWLDIVEQFGFSDQPHLIRQIKSIIGDTPNQYLESRDLTIDIYGDFKSS